MKQWAKQSGFTIVELTIVIVVIAILAAISIVGYVGVKENAVASKIQAELTQTKDQISLYAAKHGGSYPDNLTDIELTNSDVGKHSVLRFKYTERGYQRYCAGQQPYTMERARR